MQTARTDSIEQQTGLAQRGVPPRGVFFGIPLGDLGPFASLLMSLSVGFLTFFLVTFLSIFGTLFYNTAGHHTLDYAYSYKYVALPAGCVMLVISLVFFGTMWVRRKLSGG